MVLPYLMLYLTRELKLSPVIGGYVLATYGIGALFAAPLSGKLTDRLGSFFVMRASLFLTPLMLLLFPHFKSFPAIITCTLIWSIFNESFRPASSVAFTSMTSEMERKQAFVLQRLAINLGMSIGPPVGGILAFYSFQWIFIVNASTAFLAGGFLTYWFSNRPGTFKKRTSFTEPLITPSAYRNSKMLMLALALLLNGIISIQFESTMPLYVVNELKMQTYLYGLLVSVNTITILLFEVSLNQWTASWSHQRTIALSMIFWGVGFGALRFTHHFWTIAIAVLIWTVGEMIGSPAQSAYVAEIAPANRQGEYQGLFWMTYGLAYTIAPWIGTQIMQNFGSSVLWTTTFVLGLLSAATILRIKPT
jgi:MFS family permease